MDMGWMWLAFPLIILATVVVVALLLRSGGNQNRTGGPPVPPPSQPTDGPGGPTAARRILDERYARGEIDEQDYQERRRRLAEPDH
jgi:putative membrane protein